MTQPGTERKSAGKIPAVLKTLEKSSRLDAGAARSRKEKAGATNGTTCLIGERETLDVPIQGIKSVVGGDHGAM